MQAGPDARRLLVAQAALARHASAAVHLGRQHLPGQAGAQYEQDAGGRRLILDRSSSALRTRPGMQKQRGNVMPEIVGKKSAGHAMPIHVHAQGAFLLGALRGGDSQVDVVKAEPELVRLAAAKPMLLCIAPCRRLNKSIFYEMCNRLL